MIQLCETDIIDVKELSGTSLGVFRIGRNVKLMARRNGNLNAQLAVQLRLAHIRVILHQSSPDFWSFGVKRNGDRST